MLNNECRHTFVISYFRQMNISKWLKDERNLSKVATVIIFLALIRCISEPFRLQYYSPSKLAFDDVKAFLTGALIAAIALLSMVILSYYGKFRMMTGICILSILALLIVKKVYLIP